MPLNTLTLQNYSVENLRVLEFINTIWSITLARVLELNNKKKIPQIDLIIGHIKDSLRRILALMSNSNVAITLKNRDLIKLFNSE